MSLFSKKSFHYIDF
uniref:Uncharacterized protein n=1 Tax=Anguilla anguilla TaxID=7936 RepID=A0A0E9SG31_ANGAN